MQLLDPGPGCSRIIAEPWTHGRRTVVTLYSPVWRWGKWGAVCTGRVNPPLSTHTPSGNRKSPRPQAHPTPCRPLSNPCVPVTDAGTQPAKPLGITGCPEPHWTQDPPGARLDPPEGPPGGVSGPRRVCVTHSHFWAKIAPQFPLCSPPAHPRPLPLFHDAHQVNRGTQKLRKGVYGVSGCWSLGAGVSRPKPIGDHRYLWILILIHIRHNP